MGISRIFVELKSKPLFPRWRDMAEVVLEVNPGATPQPGVCFISDDRMWSVARVDVNDEAKGWAVWMGTRRIGDHLLFRDADVAKAFVFFVSMPVRGFAGVLRVAARGRRLALSAIAAAARWAAWTGPDVAEEPQSGGLLLAAKLFKNGERALASGGRLLERVTGYEFADAPAAVAFRCLATAARLGNVPATMLAVPRGTLLQPTDIRLMRTPEGLCIAGTPRDCVRAIEDRVDAGVRDFVFTFLAADDRGVHRQMEVVSRHVLPAFR